MSLLILQIFVYTIVLWLGVYLIGRNPANLRLRFTGLGTVAYALSLASGFLIPYAPTPETTQLLSRLHWPLLFLPALFWFGTLIHLLPDDAPLRQGLSRFWTYGLLEPSGFATFRVYQSTCRHHLDLEEMILAFGPEFILGLESCLATIHLGLPT